MMQKSIREVILSQLKDILVRRKAWEVYQSEIVTALLDIPTYVTDDNKDRTVKKLYNLYEYLESIGFSTEDLSFLRTETKDLDSYKQLYSYDEKDKIIKPEEIQKFITLGFGNEGTIGIPQKYNYEQVKYLITKVWNKTNQVKFYVSRERVIVGKIVAEIYEHQQQIPIARVVEKITNKVEDDMKRLVLFGESGETRGWRTLKEIESPFFIYRFITDDGVESVLLSPTKQAVGEKIVTGMTTFRRDDKQLTDSAKLSTKLMYIIAQEVESKIARFQDKDEFLNYLEVKKFKPDHISKFPFAYKTEPRHYVELKYPEWYKSLIWSFLLHKPKGFKSPYPMHLLIVGDRGSGKSTTMELLHEKTHEIGPMFSGSSSTLKSLVPSFRSNPPKIGYLGESSRFAFCDEFFRCVLRDKNMESNEKDEQIAILNDLLEHKKRSAGSGNGSVTVDMKAKVIATTNPIRDAGDMTRLLQRFDMSFLSRLLIVFQNDEIVRYARNGVDESTEYKSTINEIEFTNILDFMQTVNCKYDKSRLREIFDAPKKVLSNDLLDHYESRHYHHIECLIDGLVKYRCIQNNDYSNFTAQEEDYYKLTLIWQNVISSWIPVNKIMNMDVRVRIDYMPEKAQYLFWKMAKQDKILNRGEIQELVKEELTKKECTEALIILEDKEILQCDENCKYHTYFKNRPLTENELNKANTIIRFIPKQTN